MRQIPSLSAWGLAVVIQCSVPHGADAQELNAKSITGAWLIEEQTTPFDLVKNLPLIGFLIRQIESKNAKTTYIVIDELQSDIIIDVPNHAILFQGAKLVGNELTATTVKRLDGQTTTSNRYSVTLKFDGSIFTGEFQINHEQLYWRGRLPAQHARDKAKINQLEAELASRSNSSKPPETLPQPKPTSQTAQESARTAELERETSILRQRVAVLETSNQALQSKLRIDVDGMMFDHQTTSATELRSAKSKISEGVSPIVSGQKLAILADVDNQWALVATGDGQVGYVEQNILRRPQNDSLEKPEVATVEPAVSHAAQGIRITTPTLRMSGGRLVGYLSAAGFTSISGQVTGFATSLKSLKIDTQEVALSANNTFDHFLDVPNAGRDVTIIAIGNNGKEISTRFTLLPRSTR